METKKRIVFPKDVISRAERYDFSDDGTQFRGYLYKGTVPISYTRYKDEIFADIRLDYCHDIQPHYYDPMYEEYRFAKSRCGVFNGRYVDMFDMDKFIENCETVYKFVLKYRTPEEELKRIDKILEDTEKQISKLVNIKNRYIERVKELRGELVCQQM